MYTAVQISHLGLLACCGKIFLQRGTRTMQCVDRGVGTVVRIILAHTTLLVTLLGTDDQNEMLENMESLPQQFTLGASLAVDTFFFLSGLLTT